MFKKIAMRIGRRYWIAHIDSVLDSVYEVGMVNSHMLHALDHRLKYKPYDSGRQHRGALSCGMRSEEQS